LALEDLQLVSKTNEEGTLSSGNSVIKIRTGHDDANDRTHITTTETAVRNLELLNDSG